MRYPVTRLTAFSCLAAVAGCSAWPEVVITEPARQYTSEAGDSVTIEVTLSLRPSHAIAVWAVSSTPSEAVVSDGLRFRRSDWDHAQTITVTGVDDSVCDGDRAYGVSIYARWDDNSARRWLVDEIYLINRDDDCAGEDTSASDAAR